MLTSSREEEEVNEQMCTFCEAEESRTHAVGGRRMHREKQECLQKGEMRKIDDCDMVIIPGTAVVVVVRK